MAENSRWRICAAAGCCWSFPIRTAADYTAKWHGNSWSALGSGMNNAVSALAVDGLGHLFVGGSFSLAGTNVSAYIAQANIGPTGGRWGGLAFSQATGCRFRFNEATAGLPYRIQASP
jgi:hypothetical protein